MSGAYIYILGSHTGTLYIGVTSTWRPPNCDDPRRNQVS